MPPKAKQIPWFCMYSVCVCLCAGGGGGERTLSWGGDRLALGTACGLLGWAAPRTARNPVAGCQAQTLRWRIRPQRVPPEQQRTAHAKRGGGGSAGGRDMGFHLSPCTKWDQPAERLHWAVPHATKQVHAWRPTTHLHKHLLVLYHHWEQASTAGHGWGAPRGACRLN